MTADNLPPPLGDVVDDGQSLRRSAARHAARMVAKVMLALTNVAIKALGVGTTYRTMARLSPVPPVNGVATELVLARIARTVNIAARKRDGYCLRQALVIWWLLRWVRVPSEIYCEAAHGKGHAWVEVGNYVIGDHPKYLGKGRFRPFSRMFGGTRLPRTGVNP